MNEHLLYIKLNFDMLLKMPSSRNMASYVIPVPVIFFLSINTEHRLEYYMKDGFITNPKQKKLSIHQTFTHYQFKKSELLNIVYLKPFIMDSILTVSGVPSPLVTIRDP